MAGLINAPNMGVYNVSKHAVVAMSETLYQDLHLVTDQIGASVLCPFFVPTGITESQRNRPDALAAGKPTKSQLIGKAMNDRAVGRGKVSAADVAGFVFDAIGAGRFYIYSHPKSLASVQTRLEDIVQARNPTDPFAGKPEIGAGWKACANEARPQRGPLPEGGVAHAWRAAVVAGGSPLSSRSSRPGPAAGCRRRRRPG